MQGSPAGAGINGEARLIKSPLRYQISDYDCGPTSMLNAVSFLFEREQIPPELIRNIMLFSLDAFSPDGAFGKSGTSCTAMMFLSNWLSGFGQAGRLPITTEYYTGERVYMGQQSPITDALHRGGAVVVRLFLDEWHYVLLTGERDGRVYLFDPYYVTEGFNDSSVVTDVDHPFAYNRILPQSMLNGEAQTLYAFAEQEGREAVVLYNTETMLTPDNTIEYMI